MNTTQVLVIVFGTLAGLTLGSWGVNYAVRRRNRVLMILAVVAGYLVVYASSIYALRDL